MHKIFSNYVVHAILLVILYSCFFIYFKHFILYMVEMYNVLSITRIPFTIIHRYTNTYIPTHTHTHTYTYIHIHLRNYILLQICTPVDIPAPVEIYSPAYIYIYIRSSIPTNYWFSVSFQLSECSFHYIQIYY
jgi:hypothetical protein